MSAVGEESGPVAKGTNSSLVTLNRHAFDGCRACRHRHLEQISLGSNREDSQRFINERVCPALIRFLERAMPTPYSVDLRAQVIEDVETGASRREAAERYGISPSVVVIWA